MLGKAREIADSLGYRVLALSETSRKAEANRMIALGADEVENYNVKSVADWASAIAELAKKKNDLRLILLPSHILGNYIAGALSVLLSDSIVNIMDRVESLTESGASKSMHSCPIDLTADLTDTKKISILSLKLEALPEPFEDSSRYGKVLSSDFQTPKESRIDQSLQQFGPKFLESSSELTILVGRASADTPLDKGLIAQLASKYNATILEEQSAGGRTIYGPCIAILASNHMRELPEFEGELISLNSDVSAEIIQISDYFVVSNELNRVVKGLVSS
jgi:electron transfer flavoprotein alpha subunit